MDKFNFEELKNFEVPESWVQGALDLQKEKKKKPFLLLHYQHVIGFAAALVIAVGVSMYLFFGSGGNSRVNIPSINPQSTAQAEQNTDDNKGSTGNSNSPAIQLPSTGKDGTEVVTEPAETEILNSTPAPKAKHQSANIAPENTKAQNETSYVISENTAESENQDKSDYVEPKESSYTEVEPSTVYPSVEEPDTNSSQVYTTKNLYGERQFEFYTNVFNGKAKGDVYCRIVDKNGAVVSDGLVTNKTPYNGKTRISYNVFMKLNYKESYNVIFYSSNGEILKQRTVYIDDGSVYSIS